MSDQVQSGDAAAVEGEEALKPLGAPGQGQGQPSPSQLCAKVKYKTDPEMEDLARNARGEGGLNTVADHLTQDAMVRTVCHNPRNPAETVGRVVSGTSQEAASLVKEAMSKVLEGMIRSESNPLSQEAMREVKAAISTVLTRMEEESTSKKASRLVRTSIKSSIQALEEGRQGQDHPQPSQPLKDTACRIVNTVCGDACILIRDLDETPVNEEAARLTKLAINKAIINLESETKGRPPPPMVVEVDVEVEKSPAQKCQEVKYLKDAEVENILQVRVGQGLGEGELDFTVEKLVTNVLIQVVCEITVPSSP